MFINFDTASVSGYVSDRPFTVNTDSIAYAYPCCRRDNEGNIAFEDAMATKDVEIMLTSGTVIRVTLKKKNFKEFVEYLNEKANKHKVEVWNPKSKTGTEISLHVVQ